MQGWHIPRCEEVNDEDGDDVGEPEVPEEPEEPEVMVEVEVEATEVSKGVVSTMVVVEGVVDEDCNVPAVVVVSVVC